MSDSLRVGEAAELLGVSRETMRNWDASGRLVANRNPENNYRVYQTEDVLEVLQERKERAPEHSVEQGGQTSFVGASYRKDYKSVRELKGLVKQMSASFRDSLGGGLLERFEEITKLLYCKMYDERFGDGESRFVRLLGEPPKATHGRVSQLYADARDNLPADAVYAQPELSGDVRAVAEVVKLLQDVSLGEVPTDVKGVVYEELIQDTFDKSENQQFFTPRQVVELVVDLLEPKPGEVICDPACGSAGFLIEAAERLSNERRGLGENGSLSRERPKEDGRLVGFEIDRRMAWVAQMNLVMHGDGSEKVYHLHEGGALGPIENVVSRFPSGHADVVITNPPFGSDVSNTDVLKNFELGKAKASRRRGVLFIERCIEMLRPGGRLGIVIEDSVLNGASNEDVRHLLLEKCLLEASVSLPSEAFKPYATAKTSVLLLRKREDSEEKQPSVFMADVQKVGRKANGDPDYDFGSQTEDGRLPLDSDLPEVVEAWRRFQRGGREKVEAFQPKVFTCPPRRFRNGKGAPEENRLDAQYHHPSREIAENTLARSDYRTPKLAELVIQRSENLKPNEEDSNGIWRYLGLGGIEADTGQYAVSTVLGSQVKSTVRRFKAGDILFSKLRPSLRKCVLVREGEEDGYVSSECYVFRPVSTALSDEELSEKARKRRESARWEVHPEYLALVMRSDIVYGQLVYQTTGVGRPRVTKSSIMNLKIPLPPVEVQSEVVSAHSEAWAEYIECQRRSEKIKEQGQQALSDAHNYAVDRLCPQGN